MDDQGKKEYIYQPPLQSIEGKSISRKGSANHGYPYKYNDITQSKEYPEYDEDGDVLGNRYRTFRDLYDDLNKQNSKYERRRPKSKQKHPHMKRYAKLKSKSKNGHDHLKNRKRRHVGPHDNEGLQRLLSTGTLAPTSLPMNHPQYNNSIDFIFATYWFFPADTQAILPKDKECIAKKMSEEKIRFSPLSKYLLL